MWSMRPGLRQNTEVPVHVDRDRCDVVGNPGDCKRRKSSILQLYWLGCRAGRVRVSWVGLDRDGHGLALSNYSSLEYSPRTATDYGGVRSCALEDDPGF